MINNKSKLATKLFIAVWIVLALHITLKLTFNYWQPYVIPNDTLQVISDYIDSHNLIKFTINKLLWFIGSYFMILAGIQEWKFKEIYPIIALICCGIISLASNYTNFNNIVDAVLPIITLIILPLIINYKKWITILLTFAFNFLFLLLSLFIEGFLNSDDMQYICKVYLEFDYYIMLILNYFVFNLIRKEKL